MPRRHPPRSPKPWPRVWLVSDERIDGAIAAALRHLPRGSGLIFRHYHLAPGQRRQRFRELAAVARRRGHAVAWSGTAAEALRVGADMAYGPPSRLARGGAIPRLVTAHSLAEIGAARRMRAEAIVLSPVLPTRTHPGARALGPVRFRLLAARSRLPVIALGGMTAPRARAIGARSWAAIESLAQLAQGRFSLHS